MEFKKAQGSQGVALSSHSREKKGEENRTMTSELSQHGGQLHSSQEATQRGGELQRQSKARVLVKSLLRAQIKTGIGLGGRARDSQRK